MQNLWLVASAPGAMTTASPGTATVAAFIAASTAMIPADPVPAVDFDLAARDIHRAFAVFRRQRSTRTLV